MNERIKLLRNTIGLTQQEFADRLGIKRGTIANYELGRNEPIDAVVTLICDRFNVNEEWLRYGIGPMQLNLSRDQEIKQMVENAMKGSSEFKRAVIRMICSRTEDELRLLDEMLRQIYDNLPENERAPQKITAAARSGDRMEVAELSAEEEEAVLPPFYSGDI